MANTLQWKRIESGRVTVLSQDAMRDQARREGVSLRLIDARIKKAGTPGYVKHGVGFTSPTATYEALRGAVDNAGVNRRDHSWAQR